MRAVYIPDLDSQQDEIRIEGTPLHHLKNVVRVKRDEKILLLNGKGETAIARTGQINKKEIVCSVVARSFVEDRRRYDVAYCLTKRDSFDLAIKIAVELNVKNFYPLISDYSQNYPLKDSRYQALIASAVVQSNAPYWMNLHSTIPLATYITEIHQYNYSAIHLFDLVENISTQKVPQQRELIVIGPEGGFSNSERDLLKQVKNVNIYRLDTNILRASTALPTALGFVLGRNA